MSRLKSAADQIWPRVLAVGAILVVWLVLYSIGVVSRSLLPSPLSVWTALASHLAGPSGLLVAARHSVTRLAGGLAISLVIGTLIGLAMAASRGIQRSLGSIMVGLQALPPVAWLALALLWLGGLPVRAIVAIVVIGALPAVAIATAASVRQVPPVLVRAGRTLGAKGWELQRHIVLPAAIPGYFAGLQQAWAIAWRALLAGELIAAGARGLGNSLDVASGERNTSLVLATMLVIVVIGLAVDFVLAVLDRRIRRRRGLLTPG